MSRIAAAFEATKREGRAALIAYLCAGDPDLPRSREAARALVEAGADLLELGIPFSDPIADGPVIQEASFRALQSGTTVRGVLELVAQLRTDGVTIPIALMTYVNPVMSFGYDRFLTEAARAGVDGLIVPDLPLEQASELSEKAASHGIDLVLLAAPTTPQDRLEQIAAKSRGFLYFVSVAGVTGSRTELPEELSAQLQRARRVAKVPLAVGFGISRADQVAALASQVEGVVVGSALVRLIAEAGGDPTTAAERVRELRAATKQPAP